MRSTLAIFSYLYHTLPPLVPIEIRRRMGLELERFAVSGHNMENVLEASMLEFGYEVWPYRQAYASILNITEEKLGDHFFIPKLSPELEEKYDNFKRYGGTFRDLHSGNAAHFFTNEERGELCGALVETMNELKSATDREVSGISRGRYLKRVDEFKSMLKEIKRVIARLRHLANKEHDHSQLAEHIRARVHSFEEGLCLLGPDINFDAVCRSEDFFADRRKHLNRLRGIQTTVEVDFYPVT